MPIHSTYSSSVDVATGAVLSYGFDANAENTEPHPFYTKEAQDAFDKAELERAIR